MWPWGHVAVGYLAYSLASRASGRRVGGLAAIAVAFGTQFPDLVDKPLGWTFGVLPGGRTLAHSLITFAVVATISLWLARRYRRPLIGLAFSIGYLSHTFADGLYSVIEGEYRYLTYLLWPVLPMPPYETEQSFLAHFAQLTADPQFLFEVALVAVALVLWSRDGYPGLTLVKSIATTGKESILNAFDP